MQKSENCSVFEPPKDEVYVTLNVYKDFGVAQILFLNFFCGYPNFLI